MHDRLVTSCLMIVCQVCYKAAEAGHMHILQYAHEQGCPWDARVLEEATARDDMMMIQYAREHGCPVV
jgi:hypothetical protein